MALIHGAEFREECQPSPEYERRLQEQLLKIQKQYKDQFEITRTSTLYKCLQELLENDVRNQPNHEYL